MLQRSQSALGAALLEEKHRTKLNARPILQPEQIGLNNTDLAQKLGNLFQAKYGYAAWPQQIEVMVNLIRGRTTFLLAGTGFRKSQVPELFYLAHENSYAPILLSINPLDTLGVEPGPYYPQHVHGSRAGRAITRTNQCGSVTQFLIMLRNRLNTSFHNCWAHYVLSCLFSLSHFSSLFDAQCTLVYIYR